MFVKAVDDLRRISCLYCFYEIFEISISVGALPSP